MFNINDNEIKFLLLFWNNIKIIFNDNMFFLIPDRSNSFLQLVIFSLLVCYILLEVKSNLFYFNDSTIKETVKNRQKT